MPRILIVEDNAELAEGIRYNLEVEGYDVAVAEDGEAGIAAVHAYAPDAIILDVMLPGADGFAVLKRIREAGVLTPVMMLTARVEESDHVRAFRLDADQYVTKPFRLLELLERLAMMLRRGVVGLSASAPGMLCFGDVVADPDARTVHKAGRAVSLTPRAWELLLALAARQGKVVSRQELLRTVWRASPDVVTRTVDSHVSELRQKLETNPDQPVHIVTVWKAGYRFQG